MLTASGVALCALVCLVTVREVRREWEPYLLFGCALFFLFLTLPDVRESVAFAASLSGAAGEGCGVILRALGIAWMASAAGDLCRASGEGALAGYVEGVGRVELLVLSLPLLRDLLALAGLS
ncbi:MAG: hypothetical protein II889_12660 [Clostridia bacterium]|nr:hypothetical protein [Clostridia bacterium]